MKTAEDILKALRDKGGAIVSSNDCHEIEIANAQARGDFFVDPDGFGYVLRFKEWLARHKTCVSKEDSGK